jgi:hypothetical protein
VSCNRLHIGLSGHGQEARVDANTPPTRPIAPAPFGIRIAFGTLLIELIKIKGRSAGNVRK